MLGRDLHPCDRRAPLRTLGHHAQEISKGEPRRRRSVIRTPSLARLAQPTLSTAVDLAVTAPTRSSKGIPSEDPRRSRRSDWGSPYAVRLTGTLVDFRDGARTVDT